MAYQNQKVKARQVVTQTQQTQTLGVTANVPMGKWNATTKYLKLNTVRSHEATYQAKKDNIGIEPTVTQGWQDVWQVLCYDGGGSGVSPDGTYPDMAVGKATNAENATNATNATNDGDGNNIQNTYVKLADLDRLMLERDYPVGGEKPYVQFPGMIPPAQRWAGTSWEIDTKYQGRVLIGSGGDYAFGATGGSATHTLTVPELAKHRHAIYVQRSADGNENIINAPALYNVTHSDGAFTEYTGENKPFSIMPPYTVINYWKRTA